MLKKTDKQVIASTLLASLPGVVHGYSTRVSGDMKYSQENRSRFFNTLHLSNARLFLPEQVHSNTVVYADTAGEALLAGADAIVTRASIKNGEAPVVLGILAADCVPLLFADQISGLYAAAHAGWRGTLAGIAAQVIDVMKDHGSLEKNIFVSIGPHIEACCYTIGEERAKKFVEVFHNDRVVMGSGVNWRVSLGYANYLQLISKGIGENHIDAPPVCTFCQNSDYFSYRREGKKKNVERQIGVICMKQP